MGHEPTVGGTQGNGALPLRDDDARQRHLAGLGDCFAQDGIDIAAGIAVGRQVVGGVVINRIDGIGIDELLDGHDRGAFDLDALHILIREQQVLIFPDS